MTTHMEFAHKAWAPALFRNGLGQHQAVSSSMWTPPSILMEVNGALGGNSPWLSSQLYSGRMYIQTTGPRRCFDGRWSSSGGSSTSKNNGHPLPCGGEWLFGDCLGYAGSAPALGAVVINGCRNLISSFDRGDYIALWARSKWGVTWTCSIRFHWEILLDLEGSSPDFPVPILVKDMLIVWIKLSIFLKCHTHDTYFCLVDNKILLQKAKFIMVALDNNQDKRYRHWLPRDANHFSKSSHDFVKLGDIKKKKKKKKKGVFSS